MNKLRELIELDNRNVRPAEAFIALRQWMVTNREAIADLIDAAISISWSLPSDHPLSVALAKLEETK